MPFLICLRQETMYIVMPSSPLFLLCRTWPLQTAAWGALQMTNGRIEVRLWR